MEAALFWMGGSLVHIKRKRGASWERERGACAGPLGPAPSLACLAALCHTGLVARLTPPRCLSRCPLCCLAPPAPSGCELPLAGPSAGHKRAPNQTPILYGCCCHLHWNPGKGREPPLAPLLLPMCQELHLRPWQGLQGLPVPPLLLLARSLGVRCWPPSWGGRRRGSW